MSLLGLVVRPLRVSAQGLWHEAPFCTAQGHVSTTHLSLSLTGSGMCTAPTRSGSSLASSCRTRTHAHTHIHAHAQDKYMHGDPKYVLFVRECLSVCSFLRYPVASPAASEKGVYLPVYVCVCVCVCVTHRYPVWCSGLPHCVTEGCIWFDVQHRRAVHYV